MSITDEMLELALGAYLEAINAWDDQYQGEAIHESRRAAIKAALTAAIGDGVVVPKKDKDNG